MRAPIFSDFVWKWKFIKDDFQGHGFPAFPSIRTHYKQIIHLRRDQWDALLKTVIDLSGGAAQEQLAFKEYKDLDFCVGNRLNQRNWVDLFDALHLQWFFYFRAEDMQRLRIEWFRRLVPRVSSAFSKRQKAIGKFIRQNTIDLMQ